MPQINIGGPTNAVLGGQAPTNAQLVPPQIRPPGVVVDQILGPIAPSLGKPVFLPVPVVPPVMSTLPTIELTPPPAPALGTEAVDDHYS